MINFTKMHGIGNDYVYIDCINQTLDEYCFTELAKSVSDRHFGIGADGLVLILPSEKSDFKMRMFNADGTEAQMCGNAIRCVGKYCYERNLTDKTAMTIETISGVKFLSLSVDEKNRVQQITVNMGAPVLEPELIPVKFDGNRAVERPLIINGQRFIVTCVSMGNPHAVVFVDDVDAIDIEQIGPIIENHEMFPQKTNVEFATIIEPDKIRVRVWERGSKETLACGTGACAVLVAACITGRAKQKADIMLRGGTLYVEWNDANENIYMSGSAEFVFDGSCPQELGLRPNP